jgi:hypothetical protein
LLDQNGNILKTAASDDIIAYTSLNSALLIVNVTVVSTGPPPGDVCYSLMIENGVSDADGDGYPTLKLDCDDNDPSVNPDAYPVKVWNKRFGGSSDDKLYSMEQTSDGGYILGGRSRSLPDGNKTEPNWDPSNITFDFWLMKLDAGGNQVWDKRYGGSADDGIIEAHQTKDGGYILGGYSYSGHDGDKSQDSRAWRIIG